MNKIPPFFAIAACDPNGVMGKKGHLPWHYPEETAHFRSTTEGQIMIMGYKTYLSLPLSLFSHRISIVFTQKHTVDPKRAIGVRNIPELLQHCNEINPSRTMTHWVIGGAMIFSLFFQEGLIQQALITHIHTCYEGDTSFPLHYLEGWEKKVLKSTPAFTIASYEPITV